MRDKADTLRAKAAKPNPRAKQTAVKGSGNGKGMGKAAAKAKGKRAGGAGAGAIHQLAIRRGCWTRLLAEAMARCYRCWWWKAGAWASVLRRCVHPSCTVCASNDGLPAAANSCTDDASPR